MTKIESQRLIDAIRTAIPPQGSAVFLHEPEFAGQEWAYVKKCLDTGWVSSVGKFVDRFETMLAERCGVRHAIATVNGTAALHGALVGIGVVAGDEVLVPDLTFVATANAVQYIGAIPHFVESDADRLGVSPSALEAYLEDIAEPVQANGAGPAFCNRETGRRIRAVMPMHVFGHPVDMDEVVRVADRFGLTVVEDAAEALGSTYKGRPAGSLGAIAALSFNGNKIITTGSGGAILTNDDELARKVRHMCTTAKLPHKWAYEHDIVGFNYRLPNINAALGCAQLEQLDGLLARKKRLANAYHDAFSGLNDVFFIEQPSDSDSNYWLNAIRIGGEGSDRDDLLASLHDAGLMCRPVWGLMHRQKMFRHCPRMDVPVAENLADRLINIPSGPALSPD